MGVTFFLPNTGPCPQTLLVPSTTPSTFGARAGGAGDEPGPAGNGRNLPPPRLAVPSPVSHTASRQEGGVAASGTSSATPAVAVFGWWWPNVFAGDGRGCRYGDRSVALGAASLRKQNCPSSDTSSRLLRDSLQV